MELKKSSLYERHLECNGRIVDFGGWALPVEYTSTLAEAKAVRQGCGIFDASHMGEIIVSSNDALEFLQYLTPNDISQISPGQMQYNVLLNPDGGIIDDLMVYNMNHAFLCVVNATNKDKVLKWFNDNKKGDVEIKDESDLTALIAIQGPKAQEIISKVVSKEIANLEYLHFSLSSINGAQAIISRSGYTGTDGFEIYPKWAHAPKVWDALMKAGKDLGITPCGLGARDILRIEAGYPLYGHEIDDTTNPYEATLPWVVKLNKDFIAKEKLESVKNIGVGRKRVGIVMSDRAVPRQGYPVFCQDEAVGEITSGTFSPNANKFIGMAYLAPSCAKEGIEIMVQVRTKSYKGTVSKWPFVEITTKTQHSQTISKGGE